MSGLLGFFQKFMPTNASSDTSTYQTSLLDSGTCQPEEELEIEDEELPDYTEEPLDYKQWKKQRNVKLLKFFTKRFFPETNGENNNDSDSSSTEESEMEVDTQETTNDDSQECSPLDGPDTQQLDTQQQPQIPQHIMEEATADSLFSKKKKAKKRTTIPYLADTVHDVSRIEDIDLHTKQATIDITMVTKVFDLRPTKRHAVTKDVYEPRYRPILGSTTLLPTISNTPVQCDGPLSTIYSKCVLSLEISQLDLEPLNPARRAAAAAASALEDQPSNQRMRVFFYDHYAQSLHSILQDYNPKKQTILLQIVHVSAHSVMPYAYANWHDQQEDMLPTCLCIGGESSMKIVGAEQARFDNNQLELRIAVINGDDDCDSTTGTFREWKLTKDQALVEVLERPALAKKYQEWKKKWGISVAQQQQEEEAEARDNNKENEVEVIAKTLEKELTQSKTVAAEKGSASTETSTTTNKVQANERRPASSPVNDESTSEEAIVGEGGSSPTTTAAVSKTITNESEQNKAVTASLQEKAMPADSAPMEVEADPTERANAEIEARSSISTTAASKTVANTTVQNTTVTETIREKAKPTDSALMEQEEETGAAQETTGLNTNAISTTAKSATDNTRTSNRENANANAAAARPAHKRRARQEPATRTVEEPAPATTTASNGADINATAGAAMPEQRRRAREEPDARSAEETAAKRAKAQKTYILMSELRSFLDNHKKRPAQSYAATGPLAAATAKNSKKNNGLCEANLFAVVTGFSAPARTKRGDWKLNVTLVDRSLALGAGDNTALAAITLVVFTKDRTHLPDLRKAGEVLRIHRVVVQEWSGEMQLRGQRSTSYAVYRGGRVFSEENIVSPSRCNLREEDDEKFSSSWKWGEAWLTNHATIKASEKRILSVMRQQSDDGRSEMDASVPDLTGDLTVMVTSIMPMAPNLWPGVKPMGFIRVWDGTGISHSDRYAISAPSGRVFDPPSEALVAISKIKESREGLAPLPTPQRLCGRVVNVAVWEEPHWTILTKGGVKVGSFMRLRNVNEHFLKEVDSNCLHVSSHSWLTPLPSTTFEILELLQNHAFRLFQRHAVNPASGVLPLDTTQNAQQISQRHAANPSNGVLPVEATRNSGHNPASAVLPLGAPRHPQQEMKQAPPPQVHNRQQSSTSKPSTSQRGPQKCTTLQMLMSQPCNSTFKGTALIAATFPSIQSPGELWKLSPKIKGSQQRNFRFAFGLRDGKTAVTAVVSNAVGRQFFDMSAKDACRNGADSAFSVLSCIAEKRIWDVEAHTVEVKGKKFVVLDSIAGSKT